MHTETPCARIPKFNTIKTPLQNAPSTQKNNDASPFHAYKYSFKSEVVMGSSYGAKMPDVASYAPFKMHRLDIADRCGV